MRSVIQLRKPRTHQDCQELIDEGIATTMHATRAAASSRLDYLSPSVIAFGRDMVLNIPYQVDLLLLQKNRQVKIDNRLIRANATRSNLDYQTGMRVYVQTARKSKLDPIYQGPYEIVSVHTNGTVSIRLSENMTDRVNIRRLKLSP